MFSYLNAPLAGSVDTIGGDSVDTIGGDPMDVEVNPDFVYLLFAGYDDTLALTERIASIMRT